METGSTLSGELLAHHQPHRSLAGIWGGKNVGTPTLEPVGTNYAELKIADQDLKTIEELLTQFSQQDPGSYASRFPTDKKNNPSFPHLHTINVRNLATVMAKIASFFDAIATAVSVYLDWKREMRQYDDSGGQHADFS